MDIEQNQEKGRRRAVPKFGSFKPDITPESTPKTRPASAEKETQPHKDRHDRTEKESRGDERDRDRGGGYRERDRERERDSAKERHRGRHGRHPSQSRSRSPRNGPRRDENDRVDSPASNNDLFVVDKRGDPLIVQYGSNDRSQVPVYQRFGSGRVIGSPGFLVIHRDGIREQFSIRLPGEGSGSGSAFRDKALVTAAARLRSRRIKPSDEPTRPAQSSEDFIPLSSPRKRKRRDDDDDDNNNQSHPPDYRSIYGKARPDNLSDSGSDTGSSRSSSRSPSPSPEQDLPAPKARSVHLSRHVKAQPSDITAWLELIALQDALFAFSSSSSSGTSYISIRTADETRFLAELKLSLYQEALPHAASPSDRERLLLGMMREGSRVWGEEVLRRKWDEVVGSSTDVSFGLWKGRLDYEMGRVAGFAVEEVKGMIVRKLKVLREELERVSAGGKDEDKQQRCRQVVYVFLRLTRLLHDAGFAELAVAAWQAWLEMTFCRPPVGYTAEAALVSFADFWESEVSRIGETGAKGWRHFVEAGDAMVDPPEPRSDNPSKIPRTADPLEAWAAVEQQGAEKARMPARTLDEGTEDDPFRVVMFSDIKDLLVWFPSAILSRVQPLLADAFLVFCGLPPAGLSEEQFLALLHDPFVAATGQGLDLGLDKHDAGTTQDLTREAPEFLQQGGNLAPSPDLLFCENSRFRYLDKWSNLYHAGDKQVDISWVLRTIGHLVRDCEMEALATYYLAVEWLNDPARARKVAKGLLKQYSSNIQLYNAYALVEWVNGNAEVSHKVLSSATGLVQSPSSDSQLLWNTWTWIHLKSNETDLALVRLCSSVEKEFQDSAPSPALLLKVKTHFSTARDYSLSSQQLGPAVQFAESLMLLEYLAAEGGSEPSSKTQGNITAALSTIHSFSHELESRNLHRSPHHERLLQTSARLLYHHATHGPYRPTYLRGELKALIHLFPHNTLFLSLFAWCQPPLRIDDPVRAVLHARAFAAGSPHDCLGARRFAIHHEARAGTAHSVRAAFEAALESDAYRGSAELWIRYLRFCCSSGRGGGARELRVRAREVFYRAIGACPGAKEIYMEAFGPPMRGLLSRSELRAVVETMVEKGLRVHVDLGEFLERWKGEER
ncbi:NRDE-2, necessary for RNA interference-domain-containing protein [Corynascus novoguineensis]|uniref:NRDE-2, necessary for RNA interference-domain-containing protein n=1 Tax=Corynascus novoguineensis TaxID=1126955 RepID=A0AAN7HLC2_9PEZI|nr:NRDE-2, necessary for RNA interference-domain-containing protein [Corynascus novoguineensis]